MKKRIKFIGYRSKANGRFYWKLVAANGQKIATGNEWFTKKPGAKELAMLVRNITGAVVAEK